MDAIKNLVADQLNENAPKITVGDTVRVYVKIREGEKSRTQAFEGTVIAKNNAGIAETFTVRRVSYGVGVERVFPVHSQLVKQLKLKREYKYFIKISSGALFKVPVLILEALCHTSITPIRLFKEKANIQKLKKTFLNGLKLPLFALFPLCFCLPLPSVLLI